MMPLFAIAVMVVLYIFEIDLFLIMTIALWAFIFPFNSFLGFAFLNLFFRGMDLERDKKQPVALLLSLSWFFILILDFALWVNFAAYPQEFFILRLAMSQGWFILRGIAYALFLLAFLAYARYLQHLDSTKKNNF
ncbi:MAG: hypothetical protein V1756_01685 [Patescibacteria group bacterium]